MIITLKTKSGDDTSRFTNFYPEGLKIPPNAELGLVDISFTINKSIAIGAGNKSFELRVGNQVAFTTINIAEGTYATTALLAAAIETALQAFFNTLSEHLQSLYPPAEQTCSANNTGVITLNIVYDQSSLDLEGWNETTPGLAGAVRPVNAFPTTLIAGDAGGYVANEPNENLGQTIAVLAGDSNTNFVLAGTHQIGKDFYAVWEFDTPPTDSLFAGQVLTVVLASAYNQTPEEAPIQIIINATASTFEIKEMIGGTATVVTTAPTTALNALSQKFQIRIPLFNDITITEVAEYYLNSVEIATKPSGTDRLAIDYRDRFFPIFKPDQTPAIGILVGNSATQGNVDIPDVFAQQFAAAGYYAGYLASQTGTTGTGTNAKIMITGVNQDTGAISDFLWTEYGEGHGNGDVITFSVPDGGTAMTISVTSVAASFGITTPGTGYVDGATQMLLNVDGTTIDNGNTNATSVVVTVVGGAIQSVIIDTSATGGGLVKGTTYSIEGGNGDARILVRSVRNQPSALTGFSGSLSTEVDDENPLESQDINSLKFSSAPLRKLLDMKPRYDSSFTGGLQAVGDGAVVDNNTTSRIIHVQVDDFELESREGQTDTAGGPNGKTVGIACAGQPTPGGANEGFFYQESFNIIYNKCVNPQTVNHNELNVRLTDEMNQPFVGLVHPVVIHLDLTPNLK